ncbi:MAG: SDR family NAD(P)-dependent oxidoreductase [candidate division KSB1 bacterium]|nr:SDR family NAD(P)-dependent oxidoreductase [candidate division KSB1 bacterium]MDZ7276334.1 SDR family NAD(P)-dependent oxidoreductase [candidate division KSB1 bacterium]MDZ7287713.1 SDR family NAD(P)-dependent oxidoreductase [candidate division KSB1 bacterium]MDZ7299947.1 SDR family NAD(P)-dependent oxidoreductase [candidate division KSB1 bacterium]MDZ7305724.1 SDR family NAD(P)-dependent oxidoreductase [candidate division KSB1 bacterium]
MNLTGKVAIVTGASRGIGRALALRLAREGTHLLLTARQEPLLAQVAEQARQQGVEVASVRADLREQKEIDQMIQTAVERFGRIEILVNNAGLGYLKPVAELTTAEWDEMFAVNLRAVFLATRAALPHLRRAGGSFVVNVASLAGKNTFANGSGYTATKWGLRAFSQCLMLEERRHGLHVLTICPGSVETEFGAGRATPRPASRDILLPEDVAEAVVGALKLPPRAMLSEIDLRPSNP